jgi:uncharacterized Zn-finger protein
MKFFPFGAFAVFIILLAISNVTSQPVQPVQRVQTLIETRGDSQPEHLSRTSSAESTTKSSFSECSQSFHVQSQGSRLTEHSKVRPFVCKTCGKSYKRRHHLADHKRSHTGARPYVCNFKDCGKSYVRSSYLRTHEKQHYGKKDYKCSFPGCSQAFFYPGQLRFHQKIHRGRSNSAISGTTLTTLIDSDNAPYESDIYSDLKYIGIDLGDNIFNEKFLDYLAEDLSRSEKLKKPIDAMHISNLIH